MAHGDGVFVAIGLQGVLGDVTKTIVSTDGINWSNRSGMPNVPSFTRLNAITHMNGTFASVGHWSSAGVSVTAWASDDGDQWSRTVVSGFGNSVDSMCAGNDITLIGGRNSMARSTNGRKWDAINIRIPDWGRSSRTRVAFANGTFFLFGAGHRWWRS